MNDLNRKLQEIQKKLYLQRDGASSSSMRKKGLEYKMNWGVPIVTLRNIAGNYAPDPESANEMWSKNNRELRILATMMQDPSSFNDAEKWVNGIQNVELAEQATMNLFSRLPDAGKFASEWIQSDKLYIRLCGFLLYMRLFMQDYEMASEEEKNYFSALFDALNNESLILKRAALNSLKYLGKQSIIRSKTILANIKGNNKLPEDLKQYLYDDLLFEFESLG
ncbi:MAG: DNA alkylation repair protein [Dysgonamonadaceae bacterium]|jgi:hypothetical protein|nr:DNA alkylation repair protein [Dysgonamonadaceae bacterium]